MDNENKKPKAPAVKKPRKSKAKAAEPKSRLDLLKEWKDRKADKEVKANRRLNAYVDRLAKRYPNDYLEKIREGLEDPDKFRQTMEELEEEDSETEREYLEKLSRNVKPED